MLQTITADFYRLLRSKGFWLAEMGFCATLILISLSGSVVKVGVHEKAPDFSNQIHSAYEFVIQLTTSHSSVVLFTVILLLMVIGVDLRQKLYKNLLTVGISRRAFFLDKFIVIALLAGLQFILYYGLGFLIAVVFSSIGTAPAHFVPQFSTILFIQYLASLAWVSLLLLVLYATQSTIAVFLTFLFGSSLLGIPAIFFPDIEWFKYLNMEVNYSLANQPEVLIKITLVACCLIILFGTLGYRIFKTKDL